MRGWRYLNELPRLPHLRELTIDDHGHVIDQRVIRAWTASADAGGFPQLQRLEIQRGLEVRAKAYQNKSIAREREAEQSLVPLVDAIKSLRTLVVNDPHVKRGLLTELHAAVRAANEAGRQPMLEVERSLSRIGRLVQAKSPNAE